ncbi:transposase [Lachnospiraceae bacterium 54-53]
MRNAQLKPGYNVLIAVDSEYVMEADIFQERNDVWTLVPFLNIWRKNLGFKYASVTADGGYESEEAYCFLDENHQNYYIKPRNYERWKKRSFKKDISKRENMEYEEERETCICHEGRKLKAFYKKRAKTAMNRK